MQLRPVAPQSPQSLAATISLTSPRPARGFLTTVHRLPDTLRRVAHPLFGAVSVAVMAGCTWAEEQTAEGIILGAEATLIAGVIGYAISGWRKTNNQTKQRETEEAQYKKITAERIKLLTDSIQDRAPLSDEEFLAKLTTPVDTTSGFSTFFNYDAYRIEVLDAVAKEFGTVLSVETAPTRVKDLYAKIFMEPKAWSGAGYGVFKALKSFYKTDPGYAFDRLLDICEGIKTAESSGKTYFKNRKIDSNIYDACTKLAVSIFLGDGFKDKLNFVQRQRFIKLHESHV